VKQKVFCIGFHKTGTTSLGMALKMLGYSVTGPNGVKDPKIEANVYDIAFKLVEQYDAFKDNPWPMLFREVDAKYPGSKFVLTVRPGHLWLRSQIEHFGTQQTPMRKWIYGAGCPVGYEDLYLHRFERHNREVQAHFAGRRTDLLVLDIAEGDAWQKLCPFLGVEIPDAAFPHANRSVDRSSKPQPVVRRLRSAVRRMAS
jgi:hypothetical protein